MSTRDGHPTRGIETGDVVRPLPPTPPLIIHDFTPTEGTDDD